MTVILKISASKKTLVPLLDSTVKAGFPSPADDFIDRAIDLNEYFIHNPPATFVVRAEGDSMTGAGIFSGDYLIVDRSLEARNNDIVIALLEGEFMVKRYRQEDHVIWLIPENDNFQPTRVTERSDFEIWGIVTGVIRKVR